MDTKKLFEYESLLEALKPELTDAEMVTTMKSPDAANKEVEDIASFNLVPSQDGVYLKMVNKAGEQKKLLFMNPLVAKSLAASLISSLASQGYIEDDLLEVDELDHSTLH